MLVALNTHEPAIHAQRPLRSIVLLRAVAATLVVLYHSDLHVLRLWAGAPRTNVSFSAAGTDMLFVISGFIAVYVTWHRHGGGWAYFRQRLLRLLPLYWLLTLAMVVLVASTPALFHSTRVDLAHVIASFLMLPWPHPVVEGIRPILFPGWALNVFVAFFGLVALTLPLSRRWRYGAIAGTIACLMLTRLAVQTPGTILAFYGGAVGLDLILGVAIGVFFRSRASIGCCTMLAAGVLAATAFSIGIAIDASGGPFRSLTWGIGDAAVLFVCVYSERLSGWTMPTVIDIIGEASYAIYLSNIFVLAATAQVIHALHMESALWPSAGYVVLVAASLVAGVLVHRWIDAPLTRWARRLFGGRGHATPTRQAVTARASRVISSQFPAAIAESGATQEPPTHTTLGQAR